MINCKITEDFIEQNLRDAGCSEKDILSFIMLYQNGNSQKQLNFLFSHRCVLLEQLHQDKKQMDCLDYLIYAIKKNKCCNEREETK